MRIWRYRQLVSVSPVASAIAQLRFSVTMHLLKLLSHSLGRKVWGMDLRRELAWSEMLHAAAHPAPSGSYSAILAVAFFLSTKCVANLLRWFTIPKNHRMSPTLPGDFTFCIVATFSGLGQIPFWSTTCPKNLTCDCENWHFSRFGVSPASSSL